jgi:hypothetical protein
LRTAIRIAAIKTARPKHQIIIQAGRFFLMCLVVDSESSWAKGIFCIVLSVIPYLKILTPYSGKTGSWFTTDNAKQRAYVSSIIVYENEALFFE